MRASLEDQTTNPSIRGFNRERTQPFSSREHKIPGTTVLLSASLNLMPFPQSKKDDPSVQGNGQLATTVGGRQEDKTRLLTPIFQNWI
jgi:hypothetical protein